MKSKSILFAVLIIGLLSSFTLLKSYHSPEFKSQDNLTDMKNQVSIIEIPVTDIHRAKMFYQNLLDIKIEIYDFEEFQLATFPFENQPVTIVLMQSQDYIPSASGTTVYLNAGEDLTPVFNKIEPLGGKVLMEKTPHADESGYFALFLDSEGNRMGLNSTN